MYGVGLDVYAEIVPLVMFAAGVGAVLAFVSAVIVGFALFVPGRLISPTVSSHGACLFGILTGGASAVASATLLFGLWDPSTHSAVFLGAAGGARGAWVAVRRQRKMQKAIRYARGIG